MRSSVVEGTDVSRYDPVKTTFAEDQGKVQALSPQGEFYSKSCTVCPVFIVILENGSDSYADDVWSDYDVHLFYTMHYWGKLSLRKNMDEKILAAIERIDESEHGLFVWHDALLGFIDSPTWSVLCNVENRRLRGCDVGEEVRIAIANRDHPITRNTQAWSMTDKVYLMDEPGDDGDTILTTDNAKSMTKLAWAHEYKNARFPPPVRA